jgi:hypothetical protein
MRLGSSVGSRNEDVYIPNGNDRSLCHSRGNIGLCRRKGQNGVDSLFYVIILYEFFPSEQPKEHSALMLYKVCGSAFVWKNLMASRASEFFITTISRSVKSSVSRSFGVLIAVLRSRL